MARHENVNWNLPDGTKKHDGSRTHCWNSIHTALLMDIRDALQTTNRYLSVLACRNFLNIPSTLNRIAIQTKKRKYVKKDAQGRTT